MADADNILQGLLIGSLSFVGVITLVHCVRKRVQHRSITMKQSPSMEDLTSVETTDPQQDGV